MLEEFVGREPEYKTELDQERKKRESLEQRIDELIAENQKARMAAELADRSATIRAELQKLGVAKVELAYRVVKDDVYRAEDGRVIARDGRGLREYLSQVVHENPELLPTRVAGGSGAGAGQRGRTEGGEITLDRIRPGMNEEEKERARREIARVASQTLRGL